MNDTPIHVTPAPTTRTGRVAPSTLRENGSDDEEDFQTTPLDDPVWREDITPERDLCIHDNFGNQLPNTPPCPRDVTHVPWNPQFSFAYVRDSHSSSSENTSPTRFQANDLVRVAAPESDPEDFITMHERRLAPDRSRRTSTHTSRQDRYSSRAQRDFAEQHFWVQRILTEEGSSLLRSAERNWDSLEALTRYMDKRYVIDWYDRSHIYDVLWNILERYAETDNARPEDEHETFLSRRQIIRSTIDLHRPDLQEEDLTRLTELLHDRF